MKPTDLSDSDLKQLLTDIENKNDQAITRFWELHFDRLATLAQGKLSRKFSRVSDGEDIALSAIHSFFTGFAKHRFQNLDSTNELWNLLTTLVMRKIAKQCRQESTQKRGGGQVRGESVFVAGSDSDAKSGIANVSRSQTTPLLDVEFLDTCETLFDALPDEKTRNVARLMIEGHSLDDIADELGCVRRTVERKLQQIREIWSQQMKK
jgi:DNA-directed RNA polymerase specialized sigma24 family protein